ncbi:MAG TPA: DUF72 domain-containing protein [Gemmatimonadota bacterium]|nr:DUF72 domain-containing protein [Gemmatimonadota bacterium]
MNLWVGTSGFAYKEWKGVFYPEDLSDKEMLPHYASRLPAVEINNTFYRMPTEKLLLGWAAQVPERFRFSIKASRRITHQKKLAGAAEETEYLLRTVSVLADHMGPVLFQLPPYLRKDDGLLASFLDLLPPTVPAAFEFRHASWMDDATLDHLAARGVALCVAETEDGLDAPRLGTAGWGYLRLRRTDYSEEDLAAWAERVADQGWSDAYVFFKHEDEAEGPRFAERFLELAGG